MDRRVSHYDDQEAGKGIRDVNGKDYGKLGKGFKQMKQEKGIKRKLVLEEA